MATFVLVPGGHHGAWCWQRLVPELTKLGHRSIPVDLPCDDGSAGYDEYVACVVEAMAGVDDAEVVLVGHSLGCFTVPLVAAQRPVAAMVLLCAVPNLPGEPIPMGADSNLGEDLLNAKRFVDDTGLSLQTPADFRRVFYADIDPETADWALAQLKAQGLRPMTEAWPLEAWPSVETTVVLAQDDRVLRIEPSIEAARKLLGGKEPIVVPGGHSVFLTDPPLLAQILDQAAQEGRPGGL